MAFLVFQLRAPLASFGSTLGTLRLSDRQPRKSVVCGLLAAALGIERHQQVLFAQLVQQCNLAVCTLKEPLEGTDLHTVQTPVNRFAAHRAQQVEDIRKSGKTGAGVFSRREFLQDGHWLVALTGPAELLADWAAALDAPKFTVYLGRKAFVLSAYMAPAVLEEPTVEAAMRAWAARAPAFLPTLPHSAVLLWDVNVATECAATLSVTRTDVRTSLQRNHFSSRTQYEGVAVFGTKEE